MATNDELLEKIKVLEEKVEKMMHYYDDILFNLDKENFTPEFLKKILNGG